VFYHSILDMTGAQIQRMFRLGRVSISFQPSAARTIPAMSNSPEIGMSYFYPYKESVAKNQMIDFFETEVGKAYLGRYKGSISAWWPLLRIFCCLPATDFSDPQKPVAGDPDQIQRPAIALVATYMERIEARKQYSSMCFVMAAAIFLGVHWAPASNSC
jgi:hypothetical protein